MSFGIRLFLTGSTFIMSALPFALLLFFSPIPSIANLDNQHQAIENIQEIAIETALSIGTEDGLTAKVESLDNRLKIAACLAPLEARGEPPRGERMTIQVRCKEPEWSIHVPIRLERWQTVLYSTRNLSRGAILQSSDLQEISVNTLSLHQGYFTKLEDVQDLQLTRNIPAGQLIKPQQVAPMIMVRKGQSVQIQALTKGLLVQTQGTALADGTIGAVIPVRNTRSGRTIEGVVLKTGSVEIQL